MVVDLAIISISVWALQLVLGDGNWLSRNLEQIFWLVYFSALESSRERATVGKRLLGLAVCGSDGRRLSFPRAVIRTLGKILSLLICGIGFVMPLLTPRKQALHDLLTDSVVVRR